LKETTIAGIRHSLWVLFGSVSLLLVIACINVAALLLARTTERQGEIAIRFSLGASRGSLIAQLLTECFVLAVSGSVVGLAIAAAGAKWLKSLSKSLPRAEEIKLDGHILLYTLVCAVVATFLFGLVPALRATHRGIAGALAHAGRSQVSSRNPLQWFLVSVQVALAVTLLVGAGLLLRSFQELGRVPAGFEVSHVLTLRISANWGETADYKKLRQRIDRTLEELRATPGVVEAAVSGFLPGIPGDVQTQIEVVETSARDDNNVIADSRFVSDGYFATMHIPVLAGESCRQSLNNTAVVNRSFVNRYFNDVTPVGHHVRFVTNGFNNAPSEIRGIVADAREQGLIREPAPTVYWCLSAPYPSPYFLIRTQSDPMAMAETLRRKIHQIEPARSVFDISPLEQHLSDHFAETRLRTLLLTLFALTAVSLACIGLYGTLSYFVATRRREVGLRLALGALRGQIVAKFLVQGLRVSLLGCMAGLCLAFGFSKALSGMLYGVSWADPKTFIGVIVLMVAVAAIASLIPALRAAQVEPVEVLRDE
jgi:putative ABC transport system permease protein